MHDGTGVPQIYANSSGASAPDRLSKICLDVPSIFSDPIHPDLEVRII